MAAASRAYSACWQWGHATRHGNDDDGFYERQESYDAAELVLYDSIRSDLGIVPEAEPTDPPLPGSGWGPAE
jgi:hypothetical protein